MSAPAPPDRQLDITRDLCPMTFVKTRLELEEMAAGQRLEVLLRAGEPLANVTRAVEEEGHVIEQREQVSDDRWRLLIRRTSA